MGFAFAICNFFGGENKRSQGCSNNHRGRQLADWSAPLSIIPVTFTAPPTNAQRRRSFHNIPSICGSSAAVGEERRGKKESTSSDTAGEVRRTETERGAPREANGLWSKRRTSKRTSDLRRGLCNCPWVFLFFLFFFFVFFPPLQSNFCTVPTCLRPAKTTAVPHTPITWDLIVWRRRWGKDRQVSWDGALPASPLS